MAKTKKEKRRISGEDQKKGFRQEMRIILAVYCCVSIIEKKKKGRQPDDNKRSQAGKMPWWAVSDPRAVGC